MRNWEATKASYLKYDRPHQLGHLASSLARVRTNIREDDEVGGQVAIAVIEECQYFTEWTITTLNTMQNEADLMLAQELLTLGRQLTRWKLHWQDLWQDTSKRSEIAITAERWSSLMLERSGLLQPEL
ncbi:MAG: hypothetical protein Kow00121_00830 [Elainellaceae cyanobacterium]